MIRPFQRRLVRLVLLAAMVCAGGALLAGCGEDDGTTAPPDEAENTTPDCSKITPPTFEALSQGTLTHCVVCHSSKLTGNARNGAPDMVNFDTYASAKAVATVAYGVVRAHQMPYPDGQGITNAERNRLYEWVICGTPP